MTESLLTPQERTFYARMCCPLCDRGTLKDFPGGHLLCDNCRRLVPERVYREAVKRAVRMVNIKRAHKKELEDGTSKGDV